jgi:hypothetical protein
MEQHGRRSLVHRGQEGCPSAPPVAQTEFADERDPLLEWAPGFADARWRALPHGFEEQQIATGAEHPAELDPDTLLGRVVVVVKHGNRDHDVECAGRVGIRSPSRRRISAAGHRLRASCTIPSTKSTALYRQPHDWKNGTQRPGPQP